MAQRFPGLLLARFEARKLSKPDSQGEGAEEP